MGKCNSKNSKDSASAPGEKPFCPNRAPIPIKVEAGKEYYYCTCGKSKTQPFCDGAHQGTNFKPLVYKAEKDGEVYFCNCKRSKKGPMCDGTHTDDKLDW